MKRRNLMIGLGVLGTGAGAASLTGATLSDTVSPSANFQVSVEGDDLLIERSETPDFDGATTIDTSSFGDIPSGTLVYESGGGAELNDNTDFSAVANTSSNNDLEFGVLIPLESVPTSGDGDKQFSFPHLLQATNFGTSAIDLVASDLRAATGGLTALDGDGTFISDDGSGAVFSLNDVRNMFNFQVDTENGPRSNISQGVFNSTLQIGSAATIESNETTNIHLTVNISEAQGDAIVTEIAEQNLDETGGQVRLVDQVTFGAYDGDVNNLFGGVVDAVPQ